MKQFTLSKLTINETVCIRKLTTIKLKNEAAKLLLVWPLTCAMKVHQFPVFVNQAVPRFFKNETIFFTESNLFGLKYRFDFTGFRKLHNYRIALKNVRGH